jgi:hypothetical protein
MSRVGQHPVTPFTTPVANARPISSSLLRGNFNQLAAALTAHDANQTVHVQSGVNADRPAPGVVGRVWVSLEDPANPALTIDNGVAWVSPLVVPATTAFTDQPNVFTQPQRVNRGGNAVLIGGTTGTPGVVGFFPDDANPTVRRGYVGPTAINVIEVTSEGGSVLIRSGTPVSNAVEFGQSEVIVTQRVVRQRSTGVTNAHLTLEQDADGQAVLVDHNIRQGGGFFNRLRVAVSDTGVQFLATPTLVGPLNGFRFNRPISLGVSGGPGDESGLVDTNGARLLHGLRAAGFGDVTGALATGGTWDTGSVTLAQLAQRVGALWWFLRNYHGLIGA